MQKVRAADGVKHVFIASGVRYDLAAVGKTLTKSVLRSRHETLWRYRELLPYFDDADIVDGSVVAARIFCCGGITKELSAEVRNSLFLYVPKGQDVGPGDIVELRVGHPAEGSNPAVMNSVTRIVQKSGKEDGTCWWDPKNDRLWQRILYCEWMPKEGWVKQGGMTPAWFKPLSADPASK